MSTPHIDIESLVSQRKESSSIDSRLASLLGPALNSVAPTDLSADTTANDIDKIYSAGYASDDKAEDFFYTLWNFYIKVIKKVPADDDARQQLLVATLAKLKGRKREPVKVWREEVAVWESLPLFGPGMRDAWNFTPKFDDSDKPDAVASWLSLVSFAARALGTSLTNWTNFAIWGLREALEQPAESPAARDGQLAAAREWIVHSGAVLLEGGRKQGELDDASKRALKAGPLFEGGEPGLSDKRWAFWKQRLEDLAKETESEEAKAKAQEAVEAMNALESS